MCLRGVADARRKLRHYGLFEIGNRLVRSFRRGLK